MTDREPDDQDELRRLHSAVDARDRDIRDLGEREHRHENLVARACDVRQRFATMN